MATTHQDQFGAFEFSKGDQSGSEKLLTTAEIDAADLSGDEGEPNQTYREESEKSGFIPVVLNIVNTAIGAGILGLPYVVRQLGVILGISLLFVGAITLYICSSILMVTKNLSHHSNYVTIARHCYKSKGYLLLAITLLTNNLGSCVIYLSIFATVTQNLLQAFEPSCKSADTDTPFYCQRSVVIVFGGLLILPFNFVKTFDKLEIASFFKIVAIAVFTIITFGFYVYKAVNGKLATTVDLFPNFEDPIGVLACITSVIFAYSFLYNQFSIYKSMRNASDNNMRRAVKASMGITGFVYIVVAMSGYAIFGSETDDILTNFTKDELGGVLFALLNIAFMISSLMTYPPTYFSPRNLIYQGIMSRITVPSSYSPVMIDKEKNDVNNHPRAKLIYVSVICVTNLFIVLLCIGAPKINDLFGLLGSISTDALIFLFPMMFYLSLANRKAEMRGTAVFLLVIGAFMAVIGFITNVVKIAKS